MTTTKTTQKKQQNTNTLNQKRMINNNCDVASSSSPFITLGQSMSTEIYGNKQKGGGLSSREAYGDHQLRQAR